VTLKFGPQGTRRLARFARRHAGAMLGVLVDGKLSGLPVAIAPRSEAVSKEGSVTHPPSRVEQGELELTTPFSTPVETAHLITVLNNPLPPLVVVGQKTSVE
jgi:hypothetical protein